METNFFWELFRDTGDPICWLLSRRETDRPNKDERRPEQRDKAPSVPE